MLLSGKRLGAALLGVALLGGALAHVASAEGTTGNQAPGQGTGNPPGISAQQGQAAQKAVRGAKSLIARFAEALGMDRKALAAELRSGKSVAEVAQEKGVSTDALVAKALEGVKERLDKAVENGRITAEERDKRLEEAKVRIQERIEAKGTDAQLRSRLHRPDSAPAPHEGKAEHGAKKHAPGGKGAGNGAPRSNSSGSNA
ncbi:hypothetical protein [Brockia lithotrophica]|uniref:Uncharacterized protein n=1 Tax=Brockia lithotrophica TaxID=933949 RepID=A0A660L830_9BACL|nr:hypothetical protein [Brockia lithotrophica]RKQ89019.1 hypothetical protein C7438_0674 [Brockia lithotrophica]